MPRLADSINPLALPGGMDGYIGYADGRWPDYLAIAAGHPNVPVYAFTVYATIGKGDGVDAEPGDATIQQAAAYLAAENARGVERPIGYCPESWAAALAGAVSGAGVPRGAWRLLTAHYGQGQHICGPGTCGCPVQADGTQWIDHGTWDESLVSDSFVAAAPHPGPVEDWFDMATVQDLENAVRTVLNEGTARGETDWAHTNVDHVALLQDIYNEVNALNARLAAVAKALGS